MQPNKLLTTIASITLIGGLSAGCVDEQSQSQGLDKQPLDDGCPQGITSINITSRATIFGGASFGSVGQYEKLVGTAHGQANPHASFNRDVVDIDKAPQNACGMVEYDVDLYIIRPVDPTK